MSATYAGDGVVVEDERFEGEAFADLCSGVTGGVDQQRVEHGAARAVGDGRGRPGRGRPVRRIGPKSNE